MKRGDEIEIDIVDLDSKGDGRGTSEGRDIIVRRAVPGDRIRGRVVKKRRGRADVEITSFVDYGMSRKEAQCIHFGLCGGCRWQDLSYEDQLLLKERMVRNALHQHGF
ncbi:MAG: 23S rRNA (uracil-5-)-methyltransferase RumA, partial [Candidatus Latescibacterota bacterium]|nr:23S rRNA (uracil-5-)-methyltransferase RumA [Candidatus Latescibacterota bacterium]